MGDVVKAYLVPNASYLPVHLATVLDYLGAR
jgi:hypothetical protein